MENVTSLNPQLELRDFFEFYYQEQQGYAYVPIKHPITEEWEQHFFEWPKEKNELVSHVLASKNSHEVYFSPSLYTQPSSSKEFVKGSYTVWVEFDGNAPSGFKDLPEPTMRVRSSEKGHEHVYWKLEYFEVDIDKIELINRSLAYALNADTSGWDANQVLRPIGTINHKREGKHVTILTKNSLRVTPELFSTLPPPSESIDRGSLSDIPDTLEVIAKYEWDTETFQFFRKKEIPTGSRSSALMRLGYYCAELRMSDEEAFSVLSNADMRWGKFAKRNDRERRLLDIIAKARLKYPINPVLEDLNRTQVYDIYELIEDEEEVVWMVDGVIPEANSILVVGQPGVGKTQFSLQFSISAATGRTFLDWEFDRPRRVLFLSLEMGKLGIKLFLRNMEEGLNLTSDEKELIRSNLKIWPYGEPLFLESAENQRLLNTLIEEFNPEGIVVDALGSTTEDELSREKVTKKIFEYFDRQRVKRGLFTLILHHTRKATSDNKNPSEQADVLGSQYIAARAESIFILVPHKKDRNMILVKHTKNRYGPRLNDFYIERNEHLNFSRYSNVGIGKLSSLEDFDEKPTEGNDTSVLTI